MSGVEITVADSKAFGEEVGRKLADGVIRTNHAMSNELLNAVLERTRNSLCQYMLRQGVPNTEIEATLDQVAEAFEARLIQLDQALAREAGHAWKWSMKSPSKVIKFTDYQKLQEFQTADDRQTAGPHSKRRASSLDGNV